MIKAQLKMNEQSQKIKQPFFSVIIPVFNKEKHIRRAIDSVIAQTFQNYELIIVCDPSTDNSTSIINQISTEEMKILYRDTPGPGGYAARNLGIKSSNGNWIAFLDADDAWRKNHLEILYKLSQHYPQAKILASGWETIEPDFDRGRYINKYHKKNTGMESMQTISFEDYLKLEINKSRPFYTSSVAIDKLVLESVGMFPAGKAKRGGDVDTWLRVMKKAGSLAVSNNIGADYYRDSENMVSRTAFDNGEVIRNTVRSLLRKEPNKQISQLLKKFSNNYTTEAWLSNTFYNTGKNFILINKLYYRQDFIRALRWALISIIPRKILFKLREIKNIKS